MLSHHPAASGLLSYEERSSLAVTEVTSYMNYYNEETWCYLLALKLQLRNTHKIVVSLSRRADTTKVNACYRIILHYNLLVFRIVIRECQKIELSMILEIELADSKDAATLCFAWNAQRQAFIIYCNEELIILIIDHLIHQLLLHSPTLSPSSTITN